MNSGSRKLKLDRQDQRNRLGRLKQIVEQLAKAQEEPRVIEAHTTQRNRAHRRALTQPSSGDNQRR